eukprot:3794116-Amphidinium_carterae.1
MSAYTAKIQAAVIAVNRRRQAIDFVEQKGPPQTPAIPKDAHPKAKGGQQVAWTPSLLPQRRPPPPRADRDEDRPPLP